MRSVFITRDLREDSPFHSLAEYDIQATSLINFYPLKVPKMPDTQWLFFYSRNGVKYFLESMGDEASIIFSARKIACMGYGTAKELEWRSGYHADFIGRGGPSEVANHYGQLLTQQDSVLFLSAIDSKHSVERELKDRFSTYNIAVYGNDLVDKVTIKEVDCAIITSPKNGISFKRQYTHGIPKSIIAIGKTTSLMLHRIGYNDVVVSVTPDETGMLKALKMIEQS